MFLEIESKIIKKIINSFPELSEDDFVVDRTIKYEFGDIYTNAGLILASKKKISPSVAAKKIKESFSDFEEVLIEKTEALENGYVNFFINRKVFNKKLSSLLLGGNNALSNNLLRGKDFLFEHSSVNFGKPLHLGHLVNSVIGSSLANLYSNSSAKVKTLSFPSDTGLHIASVIFYLKSQNLTIQGEGLKEKMSFMGDIYAKARKLLDEKENFRLIKTIDSNIRLTKGDDYKLFLKIKDLNYEYLKNYLSILNIKINNFIFESQVSDMAVDIVKKNIGNGFAVSDGAIIFEGQKYGLHNRVFINSDNQPIYEAKDLALSLIKSRKYTGFYCQNVVANEIIEYSKVILKSLTMIDENCAKYHNYIYTGLLRFDSGKMSSREKNVVLFEDILGKEIEKAKNKFPKSDESEIQNLIINSFKYSILKIHTIKDKVLNAENFVSQEGDSAPYLIYAFLRTKSILSKSSDNIFSLKIHLRKYKKDRPLSNIEILLFYSDIYLRKAIKENSLHPLVHYLTELASEFNSFYQKNKILDSKKENYHYNLILTKCVSNALDSGFKILGFLSVNKM